MRKLFLTALAMISIAAPVRAQTAELPPRTAAGSITVERSLTISSVQPMSFASTTTRADSAVVAQSTEAVIRVTGDPGRVYRVTLPESVVAQPGDATVDALRVVSDNSGDITSTLTARMDASGLDRLHISGRLSQSNGITLTNVTAAVPVGVDYE